MSAAYPNGQPVPPPETNGASAARDDLLYNLLYGAAIGQLGLSPASFQLLSRTVPWDWRAASPDAVAAGQLDFCGLSPPWSAVADPAAGGRFDKAYGDFLASILMVTKDSALREEIRRATRLVRSASIAFDLAWAEARAAWKRAVGEADAPGFSVWLGAPAGFAANSELTAATKDWNHALAVLAFLANEQTTPLLAAPLNAFAHATPRPNPHYARPFDAVAAPAAPLYRVARDSSSWLRAQENGGAAAALRFGLGAPAFDYARTWAHVALPVQTSFFADYEKGRRREIASLREASALEVVIAFSAWGRIDAAPAEWYRGYATRFHQHGPFNKGFAGRPDGVGGVAAFGRGGYMAVRKTGLVVAHRPKITIATDPETFAQTRERWLGATALAIGPFRFDAAAGDRIAARDGALVVESAATTPVIFGATVETLP